MMLLKFVLKKRCSSLLFFKTVSSVSEIHWKFSLLPVGTEVIKIDRKRYHDNSRLRNVFLHAHRWLLSVNKRMCLGHFQNCVLFNKNCMDPVIQALFRCIDYEFCFVDTQRIFYDHQQLFKSYATLSKFQRKVLNERFVMK